MCQFHDKHSLQPHSHALSHRHVVPERLPTRRDFLRTLMGTTLTGASMMELAWHRAAWARTTAPASEAKLFDLQKAADGVFFAHARPQTVINCNAAVFVRSKDVVVVDAHSKPSAAASLIQQIRSEITDKPVRYVINTHFHWDHMQGTQAYKETGSQVDIIASEATKQNMSQYSMDRLKQSLDEMSKQIEVLRERAGKASSAAEKAFCADEISHIQAYQAEMKDFTLELPTITFDKTHLLQDAAFDLHLEWHGRSHTSGDVFVFCPQLRAIATGDASHCWVPNIGDGYPRQWPATIDEVAKADFQHVLGGHGPMQNNRTVMMSQRNFIEELAERVSDGKAAGQQLDEIKKRITVASLKSLQSNGYGEFLQRTQWAENTHFGSTPPLQNDVSGCVADVYRNLDRT
ncbi:MBL fold metallo-hydrolase [Occallatibacter riparius]|uniref:MBL fold metallo-hydrolase n=1 Tax=Occallatibacter riparius TaxID=1002689 RepID=A0A9J7BP08_9BACT|nr:MBL fold metallo-hydrolase [Occallatibacter riparius]UWZ82654.1 MBL fold metallo-hydrolase [Occallatibacter riparius]